MSLRDVRVYTDWKQRETEARRSDRSHILLSIITIAASILLIATVQNLPFWSESRLLLATSLAAALYLIVGAWIITPVQRRRLFQPLAHFLFVVAGILGSITVTNSTRSLQFGAWNNEFALISVAFVLLFLPGWLVSLSVLRQYLESIASWKIASIGWNQRFFYGVLGGSALITYLMLTARFSEVTPAETTRAPSYVAQHLAYIFGFRSLAEELLFRGILFHTLYRRYNLTLGPAMLIVIVLNSLLYVVAIPAAILEPHVVVFLILGPTVMSAVHTILYAYEGTIVSTFISNIIFQLGYLIFR